MEEQGRNCSCKVSKRMRGSKRMSVDWAEEDVIFMRIITSIGC